VVAPTEVVIVIKFEVELEQTVGTLIICLPYSTIEPIRSKLYAGFQSDQLEVDHEWIHRFIEQVRQAEVRLRWNSASRTSAPAVDESEISGTSSSWSRMFPNRWWPRWKACRNSRATRRGPGQQGL
jgi:hypothetical protein